MRLILISAILAVLHSGVSIAAEIPKLKNEKEKVSYSIGYQVGSDFRRQGIDIDPDLLVRGIRDGISNNKPLMTAEEMRRTLFDLQKMAAATQKKQMEELAQTNLAKGKAFLKENANKDGITTLPSGLQYKVIRAGSGKMPKAGNTVTVNYRGTLIDGTEFDSSYKRNQPASFQLDSVIPGWTEGLQLMKEGAKWQLFIPPDLAYGERSTGKVGPNSTLIFDVELISVQ
jgi:FKBP-type peptidyl-prolyl cis-trans isomerase FklB